MEAFIKAVEIFALITGVAYVVAEILQKNWMWVVGIVTGVACSISFGIQQLWASMGLNIYYVFMSVWGLWQWRKDSGKISAEGEKAIHLSRLGWKGLLWSIMAFVILTAALVLLLEKLGDPLSLNDASVTVLSAIATVWLVKSYPGQWILWIIADILSTLLCARSGMVWMTVLYVAYTLSAVYGLYHWLKNGRYIE